MMSGLSLQGKNEITRKGVLSNDTTQKSAPFLVQFAKIHYLCEKLKFNFKFARSIR